jgi:hypothetical protein
VTPEQVDLLLATGDGAGASRQVSARIAATALPPSPSARRGQRASSWIGAGALLLALGSIAWFFVLLVRDVEAADFTSVDTARVRFDTGPGWVDPRWSEMLAVHLAQLGDLRADDPEAQGLVADALLELPFIAQVGRSRVLWPDGFEVAVTLREPVACLRLGSEFVTVAADGVVLPGAWSAPPARGTGFLPVLAVDDTAREEIFEGARVQQTALVDALAVAGSMWSELDADDLARLGRIALDARRARAASVTEPGTMLWLEGSHRVEFGRSPNLGEPGELPVATKWESLARALRLLDPGEHFYDWEMVDVRWDRPELLARGGNAPEELERRAPKSSAPPKKKSGDTRSAPRSGVR